MELIARAAGDCVVDCQGVAAAVVLHRNLQTNAGACHVTVGLLFLQRGHGDCYPYSIDGRVCDGANDGNRVLHLNTDRHLVFNTGTDRDVALVLRTVARVNRNVLEIVYAVRALKRCVINKD